MKIDDVWRFLTAARSSDFEKFLDTYTRVRHSEGRDSYSRDILLSLPFCPPDHELAGQWQIRARSFVALMRLLEARLMPGAKVLDIGAGTGWLSHRLYRAGYKPCAIDLSADSADGLGAATNFDSEWPNLQAEFDRIPLADEQADAAIFNASFHYCEDPQRTLQEALRVLRPRGLMVIMDSPIYADASSGERMLEEQQRYFENLIGQRSDSLASIGFLTWEALRTLALESGLEWHIERPWYGLRWAARPLRARLRRQREPATFAIVWAYSSSSAATD